MIEIFSTQFLTKLKEEAKPKNKTSKAVLDAVRDLSLKNETSKKKIIDLESQIKGLKEENSMLMEMMEANKQNYEQRILNKEKKLEKVIEVEARLSAQNESLRKQVENMKAQLVMFKQMTQDQMRIVSSTELSEKSISQKVSHSHLQKNMNQRSFSCDLGAYLFSVRSATDRFMVECNKEVAKDCENEHNLNLSENSLLEGPKIGQSLWRSQQMGYINEKSMEDAVQMIMDEEGRQSSRR